MANEILQNARGAGFDDARFTKTADGVTALALFRAYAFPSAPPEEGNVRLCNYYIASHKSYLAAQQLEEQLQAEDLGAHSFTEFGLKQIAVRACGHIGKNTLFYHPEYGSRVAVKVILLDGLDIDIPVNQPEDFCGDCTLCEKACPSGAIGAQGFTKEKCMRYYTGKSPIPPAYGSLIYQLIGCDLCQTCCPKNESLPAGDACDFDLISVLKGKHTREIRDMVGPNYGKRTVVLNQALFYAANAGYTPALPAVSTLLDDEFCGEAARWAYEKLYQK